MKLVCILGCIVAFQLNVVAQSNPAISAGNKVPDELMSYLAAHSRNTNNQMPLKHKVIILDFWALGCIPCFRAFPEIDSLQKQYKDNIQIITVTGADSIRIKNYFAKFGKRMNIHLPNLPSIINDTILSKYFPHTFVPHIVWIDKDGKYLGATSNTEVTKERINRLLKGEDVDFIGKKDVQNINLNVPMRRQNFMNQYIKYSTTFARYVPGGPAQYGFKEDKKNKVYRLYFYNVDIGNILKIAFGGRLVDNPFIEDSKRIICNIDSSIFIGPNSDDTKLYNDWLEKYFVNYEIDVPLELKDSVFSFLKHDIGRIASYYFNIKCTLDYKNVPCYSLIKLDSLTKYKSVSRVQMINYFNDTPFEMKKQPLKMLVNALRHLHKDKFYFFINEVDYDGLVDISIPTGLKDLDKVKRALNKIGLDLVYRERPLPFLLLDSATSN